MKRIKELIKVFSNYPSSNPVYMYKLHPMCKSTVHYLFPGIQNSPFKLN